MAWFANNFSTKFTYINKQHAKSAKVGFSFFAAANWLAISNNETGSKGKYNTQVIQQCLGHYVNEVKCYIGFWTSESKVYFDNIFIFNLILMVLWTSRYTFNLMHCFESLCWFQSINDFNIKLQRRYWTGNYMYINMMNRKWLNEYIM